MASNAPAPAPAPSKKSSSAAAPAQPPSPRSPPSDRVFVVAVASVFYLLATGALREWSLALAPNGSVWRNSPASSTSEWMRAVVYEGGGMDSSILVEKTTPRPLRGKGQVLVRVVKAAGNPVDYKMARKPQWPLKSLPSIPGYDFAGVVEECDDVADPEEANNPIQVGDRVFGMVSTVSPKWGTFAEYVVVDKDFLAHLPANVSFSDGAASALAGLTALQALARLGPVRAGEKILVHAGSGGVGTYILQIASRVLGLDVYTTSTNAELCQSLGAKRVINYRKERFEAGVLAKGESFEYVLDLIGGEYLFRGMPVTGKHYVSILNDGWNDYFGYDWMIPVGEVASIVYYNAKHVLTFGRTPKYSLLLVESNRRDLETLARLLREGTIRAVIDSEFSGLEHGARKVFEGLKAGRARGKLVLSVE